MYNFFRHISSRSKVPEPHSPSALGGCSDLRDLTFQKRHSVDQNNNYYSNIKIMIACIMSCRPYSKSLESLHSGLQSFYNKFYILHQLLSYRKMNRCYNNYNIWNKNTSVSFMYVCMNQLPSYNEILVYMQLYMQ